MTDRGDPAGPSDAPPATKRIGLCDTTFARYDMARAAAEEIERSGEPAEVVRRTVPGFKDLPVACKRLIEEEGCDLVLAFGMAGPAPIDKQCAHEAALGIGQAQLMTNTPILEVFVHEDEAQGDDEKLAWLMDRRAREHAWNAVWMLFRPDELANRAGTAQRQGFEDDEDLPFLEEGTLTEAELKAWMGEGGAPPDGGRDEDEDGEGSTEAT